MFFLYMKHLCLPQKMTDVEGEIQYLIVYLFLMRLFKSIPWEYSIKKIQRYYVIITVFDINRGQKRGGSF